MLLPRIYGDLAPLWPLISPPEHYTCEADLLRSHIVEAFGDRRRAPLELLELGVGGGHTVSHLVDDGVRVTGLDLSPSMLDNCARLIPGAALFCGDLRDARLGREFDVVLLQDAADYLLTPRDILAALETVSVHLRKGGLALVAPTYEAETFVAHEAVHDQQASADGRFVVSYLSYVHDPNPDDDTFEMITVYVVDEAGSVRVIEDRHTCGLFGRAVWIEQLRRAGLEPIVHEHEVWTLFAASRR